MFVGCHGKGVEGVAFPEPHYEMQEAEPEELNEQVILKDFSSFFSY